MLVNIFLICTNCLEKKKIIHQNYRTSKQKKPQSEKLNLEKYCKFCRSSQNHREVLIK